MNELKQACNNDDQLNNHKNIVIVGESGAGKTLLLLKLM
jgi:DNA replication protein DnaC